MSKKKEKKKKKVEQTRVYKPQVMCIYLSDCNSMWFMFNREQSHTYGKRTPIRLFTNVWKNQSDRDDCKFFFAIAFATRI